MGSVRSAAPLTPSRPSPRAHRQRLPFSFTQYELGLERGADALEHPCTRTEPGLPPAPTQTKAGALDRTATAGRASGATRQLLLGAAESLAGPHALSPCGSACLPAPRWGTWSSLVRRQHRPVREWAGAPRHWRGARLLEQRRHPTPLHQRLPQQHQRLPRQAPRAVSTAPRPRPQPCQTPLSFPRSERPRAAACLAMTTVLLACHGR